MTETIETKKAMILRAAAAIGAERWTPAEIDQLRRKLLAEHGAEGKTGSDYIADVLQSAGWKVVLTQQEEAEDQFEEEFDELLRRFKAHGEKAAAERVMEVGRLGKRRAEMIARNHKVEAHKRAEKEEIASWFRIWLENPDAFFDWLDVRKQSPDFREKFPKIEEEE